MLHDSKLADDYEDPEDLAAIEDARGNINDFQLKSSDDYFVPRHLRPNSLKACTSIIVLERNVRFIHSDFLFARTLYEEWLFFYSQPTKYMNFTCFHVSSLDLKENAES